MWTKAGKQALQTYAIWTQQNNTSNAKPMFPNSSIRNTSNQERWVSYVNGHLYSSCNYAANLNQGLHIGSGTTAPTENDYKLQTQITSGISVVLTGTVRGVDTNNLPYMDLTYTITNTSSSSITIAELGLVSQNIYCCTSSTATSATSNQVLLDRTLLSTPITFPANETAAVKYRITCEMNFTQ